MILPLFCSKNPILKSNPLHLLLHPNKKNHHPIPPFLPPLKNHAISPFHLHSHDLFDEMPERTSFVFHNLKLLKQAFGDHYFIASFHSLSLKTGALLHAPTRTSLVSAYARGRDLDSSLALFDEADRRDLIAWNAAINSLVVNSQFHASIALFKEMVSEFGGGFDSTTMVIVLSALARMRELKHGLVLHGTIVRRRLDWDVCLCNALIDMYAKCGCLSSSCTVFQSMEARDSASWNSMISGCLYNGCHSCSAFYFREMMRNGGCGDRVSLSCAISASSWLEELYDFGMSVHGRIIKLGFERTSSISNSLVSFYSRTGDVEAAENVFVELFDKNVVSWNSMINCLVENGRVHEALDLFHDMQTRARTPFDEVSLVIILPLCGELDLPSHGRSIHSLAIRSGMELISSSVVNSLLDMYLKCNEPESASILFKFMPHKDLISWNTIISGYAQIDSLKEDARILFRNMLQTDLICSLATLLAILPSCNCPEDLYFGRILHCWELKYGFGNIVSAINALMFMYINCGDLRSSWSLLESAVLVSDIVSWNTIIVGCVQNGYHKDAIEAFHSMHHSLHIRPDFITLVGVLSACGNLESLLHGKLIHSFALKSCLSSDIRVTNALLTMYFRCADTASASIVFKTSSDRNLCTWNCMISGFTQNKDGRRALEFFCRMENFRLNEMSLVGVLCACTQTGSLIHGKEAHGHVLRLELQNSMFVSSALVDMYSKCGRLDDAVRVFECSKDKSVASWNAMISAYGLHGHGKKALKLFDEMLEVNVKATESTFIAVLSACSHSGLVDEGSELYNQMWHKFGIKPNVEHHVYVVDMLGRAGRITEAYDFVKKLGVDAESGVLGALLSACNDHGNVEVARFTAKRLFCMENSNTSYYVTLSNLYACCGMWNDAVKIRRMIEDMHARKSPAWSCIDVRLV